MKPANFLYILSDQHHRMASGAYGHPLVQTPHLAALAARGRLLVAQHVQRALRLVVDHLVRVRTASATDWR